jgi:hypothetical protein
MRNTTWRFGIFVLIVGVLLATSLLPAAASSPAATAGDLSDTEVIALEKAIAEEYLAFNTYTAVLAQYPLAQYPKAIPFANIVVSEQQHVSAVAGLLTKYGKRVPGNPGLTPTPTWVSLKAACQTGVDVEKHDIALYDGLLKVTAKSDLLRVFSTLRSASLNNHLPAFDACN